MMNKYLEALKIMCSDCNQVHYCICNGFDKNCNSYAPLKELVERATPKKVKVITINSYDWDSMNYIEDKEYCCPTCGEILGGIGNYCDFCGQNLAGE